MASTLGKRLKTGSGTETLESSKKSKQVVHDPHSPIVIYYFDNENDYYDEKGNIVYSPIEGKTYYYDEYQQLKKLFSQYKMDISEIAQIHKRSINAIKLRLIKLQLICN